MKDEVAHLVFHTASDSDPLNRQEEEFSEECLSSLCNTGLAKAPSPKANKASLIGSHHHPLPAPSTPVHTQHSGGVMTSPDSGSD